MQSNANGRQKNFHVILYPSKCRNVYFIPKERKTRVAIHLRHLSPINIFMFIKRALNLYLARQGPVPPNWRRCVQLWASSDNHFPFDIPWFEHNCRYLTHLPEFSSNLVTALTGLDVNNFSHDGRSTKKLCINAHWKRDHCNLWLKRSVRLRLCT